jgi:hypothetical protein
VVGETTVRQSGGSRELLFRIKITDKDPNAFDVSLADFELYDATGDPNDLLFSGANRLEPDYGLPGRRGVGDCYKVEQQLETIERLSPGQTLTLPQVVCFNLPSGYQPKQLDFQNFIPIRLGGSNRTLAVR